MSRELRRPALDERGIVLAAAMMFVLLSSVLVLTFMSTTLGERAQSSNVQTAKLALYAADAGVRAQQQILANMAQAKLDSCLTAWTNAGATGNIVKNPQGLFPAGTLNVASSATSTVPPYSATASITFSNADIADTAQTFFAQPWIDARPRAGKQSGAYSPPVTADRHPYVFMNYMGERRDVLTLAHELGHGVHQVLAAAQGPLLADTPLTLAETASVFGEMLTFRALLAAETTPETAHAQRQTARDADKIKDLPS